MQDMSFTVHGSITLSWCMYVRLGTIRRELNIRVAMVCGNDGQHSKELSEIAKKESVATPTVV